MYEVYMTENLSNAIVELERDDVLSAVKSRAGDGENPISLLDECRRGMTTVGERYQAGEYFLAELMLSAEIFKAAVSILEPYLAQSSPQKPLGKVILATLKGDIHDLGKNILATLLKAQGFEIYDMGVDVPPAKLVDKATETRPDFIGFSALISTVFEQMKLAAEMLQQAGLREKCKLMIGGGVTTPEVMDYVGADFQTVDATKGVAYCLDVMRGSSK
jgi:methylmalonyl-CoA mutase cobalamin-binding domain/chain